MTKIVNFSSLVKAPSLVFEIDGVKHPVRRISVGEYLDIVKNQENLSLTNSTGGEIGEAVSHIARCIPTLDESVIRSWDISTMAEVSQLIVKMNSGEFDNLEGAEGNEKAE